MKKIRSELKNHLFLVYYCEAIPKGEKGKVDAGIIF